MLKIHVQDIVIFLVLKFAFIYIYILRRSITLDDYTSAQHERTAIKY